MGAFSTIGTGADNLVKGTVHTGTNFTKEHHSTAAAAAGALGGGAYVNYRHSHPEFYDKTPNKGRALDKHPGGYYG